MKRESEGFAWPQGVRKTRQRERVIEALAEAARPVTVMDLAALLEQNGEPVWISTIYRILDTFAELGAVVKTPVPDSGMAVYELGGDPHKHHAVCVLCHKVIHLMNCPLESFDPKLSEQGFRVLGHRLQMYGYCSGCTSKMSKNP